MAGTGVSGGSIFGGGGPTPWWQLPGNASASKNLAGSAPDGYTYDPVRMSYVPKAISAPSINGLLGGIESQGLSGGVAGGSGTGTGTGTAGAGASGAFGTPGTGSPTVSPAGQAAHIAMPDMTASNDAAFAAAKDKVGQMSRASINALNDELGQGMGGGFGSGAQVQGTKDIIASGNANLGDTARALAEKQADTSLDVAKTNYTGDITQRGQDIGLQESNNSLSLQKEIANQNALFRMLSLIPSIAGLSGAGSSQTANLY